MFSTVIVTHLSSLLSSPNADNECILFKNYPQRHANLVYMLGIREVLHELSLAEHSTPQHFTNLKTTIFFAHQYLTDDFILRQFMDQHRRCHVLIGIIENGVFFAATIEGGKSNPQQDQLTHAQQSHASPCASYMDSMDTFTTDECRNIALAAEFLSDMSRQYFHLLASPSINIQTYMYMYISQACPTGRPTHSNMYTVHQLLTKHFESHSTKDSPAWKPPLKYESKNFARITVRESYSCVQYDKEGIEDTYFAYGSILCLSDVNSAQEMTMRLSDLGQVGTMNFHHCCTETPMQLTSKNSIVKFIPPSGQYTLCRYTIKPQDFELPIRGFYQQQHLGDNKVQILLQLKLSARYKNELEYCNVILPFHNMSPISSLDAVAASQGTLSLSKDKHNLHWDLGKKFQDTTTLEVSLSGLLLFSSTAKRTILDPFFVKDNAFAKLNFKLLNSTISGLQVEVPGGDGISQVALQREVEASTVLIWNSHGDVRHSLEPILEPNE